MTEILCFGGVDTRQSVLQVDLYFFCLRYSAVLSIKDLEVALYCLVYSRTEHRLRARIERIE